MGWKITKTNSSHEPLQPHSILHSIHNTTVNWLPLYSSSAYKLPASNLPFPTSNLPFPASNLPFPFSILSVSFQYPSRPFSVSFPQSFPPFSCQYPTSFLSASRKVSRQFPGKFLSVSRQYCTTKTLLFNVCRCIRLYKTYLDFLKMHFPCFQKLSIRNKSRVLLRSVGFFSQHKVYLKSFRNIEK